MSFFNWLDKWAFHNKSQGCHDDTCVSHVLISWQTGSSSGSPVTGRLSLMVNTTCLIFTQTSGFLWDSGEIIRNVNSTNPSTFIVSAIYKKTQLVSHSPLRHHQVCSQMKWVPCPEVVLHIFVTNRSVCHTGKKSLLKQSLVNGFGLFDSLAFYQK